MCHIQVYLLCRSYVCYVTFTYVYVKQTGIHVCLKLQVSFAEYHLFSRALLQNRPMILRSLQVVATPYLSCRSYMSITLRTVKIYEYVYMYVLYVTYMSIYHVAHRHICDILDIHVYRRDAHVYHICSPVCFYLSCHS